MSADFWCGVASGFFGLAFLLAVLVRSSRGFVPKSTQKTIELMQERNYLDLEKIEVLKEIAEKMK